MTEPPPIHDRAVETIVDLLDRERLMSVALNRPDGWPHVTTVGYLNEGLDLYFVVSRDSQKFSNLQADPRTAVAIRSESGGHGDAIGVYMAGRAREITDPAAVERLNDRVMARFPEVHVYCPGGASVAVIRLAPEIVSLVSVIDGRSYAQSFSVGPYGRPAAQTGPETIKARARRPGRISHEGDAQ